MLIIKNSYNQKYSFGSLESIARKHDRELNTCTREVYTSTLLASVKLHLSCTVCTCTHALKHARKNAHADIYTPTCTHKHTHIHTCMYACACICTCMHILNTPSCTHTHSHTHKYTHIHIIIYIHMLTYT